MESLYLPAFADTRAAHEYMRAHARATLYQFINRRRTRALCGTTGPTLLLARIFHAITNSNPMTMLRIALLWSIGLLFCQVRAAVADTIVQIGKEECKWLGYNYEQKNIAFPQPFASKPIVVVSLNKFPGTGPLQVYANDDTITAQGFHLVVLASSAGESVVRDEVKNRIGISWIATGPSLPPPPRILSGTAHPQYLVLTVIYAPPGTAGGKSSSSVSYEAGSTTGSSVSSSHTFKTGSSLTFQTSVGIFSTGGGAGASFEYARSTTDNQSLEIKKSTTAKITRPGPSKDGIEHDEDEIWLLLKPTIDLSFSSSSSAWMLASEPCVVQYVHVGWLNGHEPMPAGVASALQGAGITQQEYTNILARDPLASGGSGFDPHRFVRLNTTFPYEPPYAANDPVPSSSFNISASSTETTGSATEDTYRVSSTVTADADFLGLAKASFKDTLSWEWTSKASQSTSTGTSQTATVTIGGPAYGYSEPTVMAVYLDTLYNTFAFALVPTKLQEVAIKGTLLTATHKPSVGTEVTLAENSRTHRTFTNAKGEFTFFGSISGPATVAANGVTQVLQQSRPARDLQLQLQ